MKEVQVSSLSFPLRFCLLPLLSLLSVSITDHSLTFRSLSDLSVHRWLRILDFSLFRTQGLRRTIGEGYDSRFVTANRLLALVTAAEGLTAFGASETMDSALSFEVLEALVSTANVLLLNFLLL